MPRLQVKVREDSLASTVMRKTCWMIANHGILLVGIRPFSPSSLHSPVVKLYIKVTVSLLTKLGLRLQQDTPALLQRFLLMDRLLGIAAPDHLLYNSMLGTFTLFKTKEA